MYSFARRCLATTVAGLWLASGALADPSHGISVFGDGLTQAWFDTPAAISPVAAYLNTAHAPQQKPTAPTMPAPLASQ